MEYQKQKRIVIANGGTTSPAFRLGSRGMIGIFTPATITSSAITFTTAPSEDGTYVPVKDSNNNVVSVAVSASNYHGLDGAEADALAACDWLKLVCGSAEGAERILTVVIK